ncbi:MAG: hypothetical protein LQ351_002006 [Letrouitia transgressa]|nr:MAG: hypothetical protein LQ351_002006 [Letrouitia transgressa]
MQKDSPTAEKQDKGHSFELPHLAVFKARDKHTPRSPGFLNHERSEGRREYSERKKSFDEIGVVLRTTGPPAQRHETIPHQNSVPALSRADSRRKARIVDNGNRLRSGSSLSFKRILRLSRSGTGLGLTKDVALQKTLDGRKYLKIVVDPKMYEMENLSVYKINCKAAEDQRHEKQAKNATLRGKLAPCEQSGRASADDTSSDRLKSRLSDPNVLQTSEEATSKISKGNLPSPELGPSIRDSAAATLSLAQRYARSQSYPDLKTAEAASESQNRKRNSPVRSHLNHAANRQIGFRRPYPVPAKFKEHPRRTPHLEPKTPRNSLDEATAVPEASPKACSKSKQSSPLSANEDNQSDAYSGEIMNAQSAEYIQGHGAFGYYNGDPRKAPPPKPGPAPTRALPPLPEGQDPSTPKSAKLADDQGRAVNGQNVEISPIKAVPRSPAKTHRYRLSPVTNSVPKEYKGTVKLKPSPSFNEKFPQPPTTSPRRNLKSDEEHPGETTARLRSPQLTTQQKREVDAGALMASRGIEALNLQNHESSSYDPDEERIGSRITGETSKTQLQRESSARLLLVDTEEKRPQRTRALKARDMERVRFHADTASPRVLSDPNMPSMTPTPGGDGNTTLLSSHEAHLLAQSEASQPYHLREASTSSSEQQQRHSAAGANKMGFSPIMLVAQQQPLLTPASENPHHVKQNPSSNHGPCFPPKLASSTDNDDDDDDGDPLKHPYLHAAGINGQLTTSTPAATTATKVPDRRSAQTCASTETAKLGARVAALERRNMLLERAFLAVIDTSAEMGGGFFGASGGGLGDGEARLSGGSEVLGPLRGRLDAMIEGMLGDGGR